MKISGITCNSCKEFIYSRARHDMHYCSCGKIFIDGGFEYVRCGWDSGPPPEIEERELEGVEKQDLFEDWNFRRDKYGIIKG